MRKKIIIFTLILSLFISYFSFYSYALSASSAVVMLCDSCDVLFEKDAHTRRSMASTTKIMTALLAVESGRLNEIVTVTDNMVMVEGTSMGLRSGNKLTLYNIVKGMMLLSGNDAANAVALFLCGSKEKFAALMNKKAKEIGMTDTNFVTPSGLDDDNHYSTAYDMALLACYAMKKPIFRELVSEYMGKVEYIDPDGTYTYRNHNRFLTMYDGACGIKTGFTKKSGRCLVTAVEKNGSYIIAVTLNAPDDWNDHIALYNEFLPLLAESKINDKFDCVIPVVGGDKTNVKASLCNIPEFLCVRDNYETSLLTEKFLYAPVSCGDIIGYVRVYLNEITYKDFPLKADESINLKNTPPEEMGLIYKIKDLFRRFERWLITA